MHKQQTGFTLIELIAVMVILGILAATAIPKFLDMSTGAAEAATAGVAAGIESASALNHAVDVANDAGLTTDTELDVANCTDGFSLLTSTPAGYTITAAAVAEFAVVTCTITGPKGATGSFVIIGADSST